jgi:hypothetical protein
VIIRDLEPVVNIYTGKDFLWAINWWQNARTSDFLPPMKQSGPIARIGQPVSILAQLLAEEDSCLPLQGQTGHTHIYPFDKLECGIGLFNFHSPVY